MAQIKNHSKAILPTPLPTAATGYANSVQLLQSKRTLAEKLGALIGNPELFDFFERAVDGLWIWNLQDAHEGGTSYVTPAFCRVFGFEPSEVDQGTAFWRNRCHPADWEGAMQETQRAIEHHGVYDFTTRMRHKDGRWRWGRCIGLIVYSEEGTPLVGYGIQHDVTELMRTKAALEHEVARDPLTGLLNRRGINAALGRIIAGVRRYNCHAYGLVMDIDNFKSVNDDYGLAIGDRALKNVADVIQNATRVTDDIGRVGGDEFIVFMLVRSEEEGTRLAERIRESIAENNDLKIKGEDPIRITVSSALIHIGNAEGACLDDMDQILTAASPYLKRGKQNGRNRVVTVSVLPPPRKSYSEQGLPKV